MPFMQVPFCLGFLPFLSRPLCYRRYYFRYIWMPPRHGQSRHRALADHDAYITRMLFTLFSLLLQAAMLFCARYAADAFMFDGYSPHPPRPALCLYFFMTRCAAFACLSACPP